MAFDFTTLVTDRTDADLNKVKELFRKRFDLWTDDDLAYFSAATQKGAYNYTDLNRVTAAMDAIAETFAEYGYTVAYERVSPSQLPAGYTELAYIESNGTQYVDTGFVPDSNTRVVIDCQLLSLPTSGQIFLFGSRDQPSGARRYGLTYLQSTGVFRNVHDASVSDFSASVIATGRHFFDKNGNICTVDNSETVTGTEISFVTSQSLYICASNEKGVIGYIASMRVYSCQIYDNGTLVRNYVPCKKPDGVYGLYDLVGNTFGGNAGTGSFIAGDTVAVSESEWNETHIPTAQVLESYLQNVKTLRAALTLFSTTPEPPATMSKLTIKGANNIEKILQDIAQMLTNIKLSWYYSGDIYSGEGYA